MKAWWYCFKQHIFKFALLTKIRFTTLDTVAAVVYISEQFDV